MSGEPGENGTFLDTGYSCDWLQLPVGVTLTLESLDLTGLCFIPSNTTYTTSFRSLAALVWVVECDRWVGAVLGMCIGMWFGGWAGVGRWVGGRARRRRVGESDGRVRQQVGGGRCAIWSLDSVSFGFHVILIPCHFDSVPFELRVIWIPCHTNSASFVFNVI